MAIFYSAEKNGFFDDAICPPPDDAVPVTAEEHAALLDAQGAGKRIQAGPGGRPIAEDPPPDPFNPALVSAECRRRIFAVASQTCQTNMTAFVASGQASDADRQAFGSALGWVGAMRGAYAALLKTEDMSYAEDGHWPACPADAAALAARF